MFQHRRNRLMRLLAVIAALAIFTAACGNDDDDDTGAGDGDDTTTTAAADDNGDDGDDGNGDDGNGDMAAAECDEVSIGWIPWDEDVAVTNLWEALLEEQGVSVETTQSDVGPVYTGVASGDLDLFLDAWLPATHADYWEEFEADLESLAIWYDEGTLELTVPAYVDDVDSIADLADNADAFDSQIVGIEPGSGIMGITADDAMPTYGLDDWDLVESGTPAMLAELERAINNEEPIVVTLWHPHWAYGAYDLKDLEDPEGSMGEAEELHAIARADFSSDCPVIAEWISNFEMDGESLAALTNLVINEADSEMEGVEEWLSDEDNRALADSWMS
ncbi:MAG: glycine betaine ABC transporter substrate-binding protein [Acidimicrobiales bacterium]